LDGKTSAPGETGRSGTGQAVGIELLIKGLMKVIERKRDALLCHI
jgi:hypothetical protein